MVTNLCIRPSIKARLGDMYIVDCRVCIVNLLDWELNQFKQGDFQKHTR